MTTSNAITRACWCGTTRARRRYRLVASDARVFPMVECCGCGVHALCPMPTPEELRPYYAPEYYGTGTRKFIGPVARLVARFQGGRARLVELHLARRRGQAPRVLDVGCGNGGFLVSLSERGYACEGTEWTADSAARVPRDAGIAMHVGDLLDLDLPAGAYDAVTLWHVFEHLADPAATLTKIHGLLAPGGRLFLSLPNQESAAATAFGRHWFHLDPPRHLHGFGPRSLGALLRGRGFRVEWSTTWSFEQNPYGIVQSVLNAAGFPRERAYETLKGARHLSVATRATDVALVGLLTVPAIAASVVESALGCGGTMTFVARRARR